MLLIDKEHDNVLFRRDPSICLTMDEFFRVDSFDRPYVVPSWQLFFKAKNPRSKDRDDFLLHVPTLSISEKRWLLSALQIHQPTSSWICKLKDMLAKKI